MSSEPRPPRVLIVDDDPSTRLLAGEALAAAGFEVDEVADGEEALAAHAVAVPALILLDVQMPGLDGYEVCRRLRRTARGAGTPILVMTASDDIDAVEQAFLAGATDFLTKPLNLPLLAHRVHYLLRAARAFEEVRVGANRLQRAQRLARLVHWQLDAKGFEWSADPRLVFAPPGLQAEAATQAGACPAPHDLDALCHPDDRARVAALLHAGAHQADFRILLPGGAERLVHQEAELVDDGHGGRMLFGATQDITELRMAEREIARMGFFDDLTGLPNATFMHRYLRRSLAGIRRGHAGVAVLTIGLGLLRRTYDVQGQSAGDALMRAVASRAASCLPADVVAPTETGGGGEPDQYEGAGLLARVGDDELAVVLRGPHQPAAVRAVAERLARALSQGFTLEHGELFLAPSVGVATMPQAGEVGHQLLGAARAAMCQARQRGVGVLEFDDPIRQRLAQRAHQENRLRAAVAAQQRADAEAAAAGLPPAPGELVLYYQPRLSGRSGLLAAVEAHLCWQPADGGGMTSAALRELAEGAGLGVTLGEWALSQACRQGAAWASAGRTLRISVALTRSLYEAPGLATTVQQALVASGLPAAQLELRLHERELMDDRERAVRVLGELERLGVRLALDDFGKGSYLEGLGKLPLDVVKLHSGYLAALGSSRSSKTTVSALISMAISSGAHVAVDGVDTAEQALFMERHASCDLQGRHVAAPMPADELWRRMQDLGWVPPTERERPTLTLTPRGVSVGAP